MPVPKKIRPASAILITCQISFQNGLCSLSFVFAACFWSCFENNYFENCV